MNNKIIIPAKGELIIPISPNILEICDGIEFTIGCNHDGCDNIAFKKTIPKDYEGCITVYELYCSIHKKKNIFRRILDRILIRGILKSILK